MPSASDRSWAVSPTGSLGEYNLPRDLAVARACGEGETVQGPVGRALADVATGWGSGRRGDCRG